MKKNFFTLTFSLLLLAGCSQQPIPQEKIPQPKAENKSIVKTYINEEFGYEIQYPSFMTVTDTWADQVNFSNSTCAANDGLCILGIDSVQIDVSENTENLTLEQYSKNQSCKKTGTFKIFPLPETFDDQQYLEAVRCGFGEVPKQAKGGYIYTLFNGNKIYNITFYQGDTTQLMFKNGRLENLSKDDYDPLGDMMIRTFKFTE